VPPDQGHAQLAARRPHLPEEGVHRRLGRASFGQEDRRQEPAGRGPAHREVVRVHDQDVPAEVLGHERDRIGRGHEIAVAHVEHRGILPDARPDDHPLVQGDVLPEELHEERARELSDRQRHWVALIQR
jgi:hypothetical protein